MQGASRARWLAKAKDAPRGGAIGDSEPWGNSVSPAWLCFCALTCAPRLAVRGSRHKPCAAKCFRCAKCYGYLPCIRARCEAALGEKISRGGDEKIRSDIRYRESFFESIRRYFPFKALRLRSSYGYPKPSRGVRWLYRFEEADAMQGASQSRCSTNKTPPSGEGGVLLVGHRGLEPRTNRL